jgi:hypothetical protein
MFLMLKYIRLFENYKAQKDLEDLTDSILKIMAEEAFANIYSNLSIDDFISLKFKDLNHKAFGTLDEFLLNFRELEVHIVSEKEFAKYSGEAQASYITVKDEGGTIIQRLILLKENKFLINNINDSLSADWNPNDRESTNKLTYRIIDKVQNTYRKSLIHELKHAWDDWISNDKFKKEPKHFEMDKEKYKKIASIKIEDLKEEERELLSKHYKDYLNLSYEVDARFASAMAVTDFYEYDLEKSWELNHDVYSMIPFNKVLRSFKINIHQFNFLIDSEKKRVLKKIGQFYELEKEFVAQKNKESIKNKE